MMGTFLIFITTSIIILTIYGFWLGSKKKKDLNISNDDDDRKSQNKKELNLNEDVRNEIIFKKAIRNDFEKLKSKKLEFDKSKSYQDLLDNFKNLRDDEIIKAVYKFSRNVYIEELDKFSFDRSNLIDNYLNPTDNIRLLNLLENVRDGLKVTRDALLDQLGLDEFQCKILEMSFKVTVGEVEKPVLEGYLRSKKVKMLKETVTLNKSSLISSMSDQIDSKPLVSPIAEYDNSVQNSLLFYKFIQTDKGTKPLVWSKTSTKMIGGVEVEVNEQPYLGNKLENSLFFYVFTQTKRGIVTSTKPLTGIKTSTQRVSVEFKVRRQAGTQGEVKFGFTAIKPEIAAQMNVAVGDELPLVLTEKPVVDGDGNVIPNLFWAH